MNLDLQLPETYLLLFLLIVTLIWLVGWALDARVREKYAGGIHVGKVFGTQDLSQLVQVVSKCDHAIFTFASPEKRHKFVIVHRMDDIVKILEVGLSEFPAMYTIKFEDFCNLCPRGNHTFKHIEAWLHVAHPKMSRYKEQLAKTQKLDAYFRKLNLPKRYFAYVSQEISG